VPEWVEEDGGVWGGGRWEGHVANKKFIWDIIMGSVWKTYCPEMCPWTDLRSTQLTVKKKKNVISSCFKKKNAPTLWIHNWSESVASCYFYRWRISNYKGCVCGFSNGAHESDSRLTSERQTDELRGPARHTADLNANGSERDYRGDQSSIRSLQNMLSIVSTHNSLKGTRKGCSQREQHRDKTDYLQCCGREGVSLLRG